MGFTPEGIDETRAAMLRNVVEAQGGPGEFLDRSGQVRADRASQVAAIAEAAGISVNDFVDMIRKMGAR